MIIQQIGQYAITFTIDTQAAVVLMEALSMVAQNPKALDELEGRIELQGQTSFTPVGVMAAAEQAIDILSRATGIQPYCGCPHCSGAAEEGQVEEGTGEEAPKPN